MQNYIEKDKSVDKISFSNVLSSLIVNSFGPKMINNSTITRNYIFFSTFTTSFEGGSWTVLGIFNNFIPISTSEKDKNLQKN